MRDEIIAICSRDNSGLTVGVEVFCRKCDCTVWLSDSTIENIKESHPDVDLLEHPPVILCIECGLDHMKKNSGKEQRLMIPPSQKQIAEIVEAIKKLKNEKDK